MTRKPKDFLALKTILENMQHPEQIDSHPWAGSLFVQDAVKRQPALAQKSPGWQLILAVADLFPRMMPSMPPKQGKRLDPRWGEFGILAAQYFAPLSFGTPFPTTMRDAWGRIDAAILLFVQEKSCGRLRDGMDARYRLVGGELEDGPASTMSDWRRKGMHRLLDIIRARERYLETISPMSQSVHDNGTDDDKPQQVGKKTTLRLLRIAVIVGVVLAAVWGAIKARRIYFLGQEIHQDIVDTQALLHRASILDAIVGAAPVLDKLDADLDALQNEVEPLFWLTDRLGWAPVYGGDLAQAREVMQLATLSLRATKNVYTALSPALQQLADQDAQSLPEMLSLLVAAQPGLADAQTSLQPALGARAAIDAQRLSPEARRLLVNTFDPLFGLMEDGLSVAVALPHALGASNEGPKTYLLLVENEDELRPTGGFVTAVGNLVVQNGEILSLSFEDSGIQEDWSKPYPVAPWQLQEYMNSRVLVLRDSNWFTDFPTAALYAEFLYSYTHDHSVDGVIAFDQQALVILLEYIGSVDIDGAPGPVTADNVIAYMRAAKVPPPEGFRLPGEERKDFIAKIADAVLDKILDSGVSDWEGLGKVVIRILEERHMLLQFDDETITQLLAKYGWDGALRAERGDFLMVVDANIGFNKTNAVVTRRIDYDIDLTIPQAPKSSLLVTHTNNASETLCIHWDGERKLENKRLYPIDRCYWNYFRVYVRAGTNLLAATPHEIPGAWMILGKSVPAQVDVLDESLDGIQGFGTLLVIPGGEALSTGFDFDLPQSVIEEDQTTGVFSYRLTVKKQPGSLATPLTLRVHLPSQAVVESVSMDALVDGSDLLINANLTTDMEVVVKFYMP